MLRKLLTAAVFLLCAATAGSAWGQDTGTIAGTVTDSTTAEAIPGVNVVVQELNTGSATNPQGEFEITGVPEGSYTVAASFVGYQTREIPVDVTAGETTQVDIALAPQAIGVDEVVVTALGTEREKRSLGYAVSNVSGDDVDVAGETNFIGNLTGKVAGAQINNSSQMGGSSRIVLRGPGSISGENQPLIVVDGIPLDNSNFNSSGQNTGGGGYDYGNAASLINPSDIQSVSVLKGPSATALYGSRAADGVIEITTKSGAEQEGIGVTVQTELSATQLYGFPDYQNKYGGGSTPNFSRNEQGQRVVDFGTDQSWGPRLDGREVREWFSYDDVNGLQGETTPWDAHPDNVQNFFNTGLRSNTNVALAQGADDYNYRITLNNLYQEGNSPESNLDRRNIGFNGSLDFTEELTTRISFNYINEQATGRPGSGYTNANGPWLQFNHFGQRQIDLSDDAPMRNITRADGTQRGWNWIGDPANGDLIYANNPFWIRERNFQNDERNRLYGKVEASYDLTETLDLTANARTDYYTLRQQERIALGSVEQSEYEENVYEVQESNFGAKLSYDDNLTPNVSLTGTAGTNYRYASREENLQITEGGLAAEGVFTINNSVSRPDIDDYFQEQGILGVYVDATVGYNDLVYLGGSVRNDWSSTLPNDNNRYIYPSVSGSFVFSSLSALQDSDILSYGRLRANWAQVGRDTDPYRLAATFPLGTPVDGQPTQRLPRTLNNSDLEPEIKTGWEVGTELQFFQNRIGLDATYYSEVTDNQILRVGASRASGFETRVVNAGSISNRGVELVLNVTPVLTEDFQWDMTFNWAKNVNEVEDLAEGVTSIPLDYTDASPPFGPTLVAREGEPFGTFFGSGFVENEDGEKVLNSDGSFQASAPKVLGDYQPDWTGGFSTTLSYQNFTATMLIDGQKGGDIWSLSNLFGLYSGIFEETAEGNIRQLGITPQGVLENGEPFTETIRAKPFFQSQFGNPGIQLYDASYIKLREVTLSYRLPTQWFASTPIQGLNVSLFGRNLATLLKYTPNFDPTAVTRSSTNLQGIEAGQVPPTRTMGMRVRLDF